MSKWRQMPNSMCQRLLYFLFYPFPFLLKTLIILYPYGFKTLQGLIIALRTKLSSLTSCRVLRGLAVAPLSADLTQFLPFLTLRLAHPLPKPCSADSLFQSLCPSCFPCSHSAVWSHLSLSSNLLREPFPDCFLWYHSPLVYPNL